MSTLEKFLAAGIVTRIATAVILVAVLVGAWVMGGWYIAALVALIAVVGMGEFLFMFQPSGGWGMKILGLLLCGGYVAVASFLPAYPLAPAVGVCFLVCALYALICWSREKTLDPLRRAAVMLCGIVYVPVLLAPAIHFNCWEQLLIVLVPAVSDIFAYLAGVCFGSHKIWPTVSPKKSIEGSIVGLLAAVAASCILGFFCGKAPVQCFAVLGLVMGVMAQLGDFFESALKRSVNVKDSSRLLPGHGGVLDRLDSITFCAGTYAAAAAYFPFF